MEFQLEPVIAILQRTPATLRALLAGLSPAWTQPDGDRDAWSPHAVVGHLLHAEETNFIPRAEMILHQGESHPFESFDRYAQFERFGDRPLDALLDLFAERRQENLARLDAMHLTPAQLDLRGVHPELGTVTLRQLIATWAVHDLNHLGQVAEGLSKPYAEAVGPWKANLPILTRS